MPAERRRSRKVLREGIEADGVIVGFDLVDGGSRPVVRWIAPDGQFHVTSDGLPVVRSEWRGRGDLLRMVVLLADPAFAVALSGDEEPDPATVAAQWGRRVEATVVAHVPDGQGSTQVRVRYFDRGSKHAAVFGPALRVDPREEGDVVDVGLTPDSDAVQRRPAWHIPTDPGVRRTRLESLGRFG